MFSTFRLCGALLLTLGSLSLAAPPAADGLYADINTSLGQICMELHFEEAPRTVANFVSLAEGTRTWLDVDRQEISQRPFYNGRIFHRAIENFVIQAGRQTRASTPGYVFNDEFSTALRHDKVGVVSMANSGPNSNGSQFFISTRPLPGLDFDQAPLGSQHAVFGQVISGMSVVTNISATATDTNDAPLVDIVIQSVTIVRQGAAANAFDPTAVSPGLPVVQAVDIQIAPEPLAPSLFRLSWPSEDNGRYWLTGGENLENLLTWSGPSSPFNTDSLIINPNVFGGNLVFFAVTEVLSFEP